MSLTTLPEEILDIILLELNVEDILNVFLVVGDERSEGFWKKFCVQNGFQNVHGEKESWREVFLRNINWFKGSYSKNEFMISDLSVGNTASRNGNYESNNINGSRLDCIPDNSAFKFILKGNKLVFQTEDSVVIRNVETPQEVKQKLKGSLCLKSRNQSRTKLLVHYQSHLNIYSCEKELYEKLFVMKDNGFDSISVLTDNYFVCIELDKNSLTIVDLCVKEIYLVLVSSIDLTIPPELTMIHLSICSMFVCDLVLNIVMMDRIRFRNIMRRYHLQRKEWLEDLILFEKAVTLTSAKVEMNSRVLVSWCGVLSGMEATVKVWTTEDASDVRASTFTPVLPDLEYLPYKIWWLLLEDVHVIYSFPSPRKIFIRSLKEPENKKNITLTAGHYVDQSISSGFLVLSYTNCFKVIDIKKATVLYDVLFDRGLFCLEFCINEYYYMNYYWSVKHCSYILYIYDFKGKERLKEGKEVGLYC